MSKTEISVLRLVERIPDEAAAYEYLEELRWGGTPVCPHCGCLDRCYFLTPANGRTRKTRTGAPTQRRLWKCGACRKQFSVLTDTVMHGTKIPIRVWVLVLFEMCASKNGISAREIERKYDLCPRSAWFLTQRIREAMKDNGLAGLMSGTVIADETWIGGKPSNRPLRERRQVKKWEQGESRKTPVLSLVNPETGRVRSRIIPDVTGATLSKMLRDQADMENSTLVTDEQKGYRPVGQEFVAHRRVNHSRNRYVNKDGSTTNAAEGYFSQLKRSLDGTHHHVSREHLARYLAEFDYRFSTRTDTDSERVRDLVSRVGGRRLSYKPLTQNAAGVEAAS